MSKSQILLALASDLKRISLAINRSSLKVGYRFILEAKKEALIIHDLDTADYIKKITHRCLLGLDKSLSLVLADELLTYSILLQNYALKIQNQ